MPRRIWIVSKKANLSSTDKTDATFNGCPEIANGIPPALQGIVSKGQLPFAYEEPESPAEIQPRDLAAEIDDLKARIIVLEPKEV